MPENEAPMADQDELSTRKASVRRLVLSRRTRLDEAQRAAAGGGVAEAVLSLPEVTGASAVLGFASFGTELPTDPTMDALLAAGKRLLLPYVDGRRLCAAEVSSVADLAPGYRGIREPILRTPVDLDAARAVLVPGVAFDASGRRLGYGGGFYDGLLADVPREVPRIGLCFDLQIVEEVPAGDGDERVELIVTERRVIRCDGP
jgi:5-formyltetrahydrofolate cyclo-ligase